MTLDVYLRKIVEKEKTIGYAVDRDFPTGRRLNVYNCYYNFISNHYVLFERSGDTQRDLPQVFKVKNRGKLKEVDKILYSKAKEKAEEESKRFSLPKIIG